MTSGGAFLGCGWDGSFQQGSRRSGGCNEWISSDLTGTADFSAGSDELLSGGTADILRP